MGTKSTLEVIASWIWTAFTQLSSKFWCEDHVKWGQLSEIHAMGIAPNINEILLKIPNVWQQLQILRLILWWNWYTLYTHYKKKLFLATWISPRVRSLYTWRTVGHVQMATWKHVVNPDDTKCTFRHVYFNTRGWQLATCTTVHAANSWPRVLKYSWPLGHVCYSTHG
jgi:hypothetical protein